MDAIVDACKFTMKHWRHSILNYHKRHYEYNNKHSKNTFIDIMIHSSYSYLKVQMFLPQNVDVKFGVGLQTNLDFCTDCFSGLTPKFIASVRHQSFLQCFRITNTYIHSLTMIIRWSESFVSYTPSWWKYYKVCYSHSWFHGLTRQYCKYGRVLEHKKRTFYTPFCHTKREHFIHPSVTQGGNTLYTLLSHK